MSNDQFKQGQNDANQGKGAASTNDMTHQDANKYNAGFNSTKQTDSKK